MAYKVFLDFGHGGSDPGASGNGLVEKVVNLTMGLSCKATLEQHGVIVNTSRTSDRSVSLSERCRIANDWKADYFVSIHNNAGGGDGAETIHSIYEGAGKAMAQSIADTIHSVTGQNIRRVYSRVGDDRKDYYFVIKNTSMHALIVEGAFLDNATDVQIIDTVNEQEIFGQAIARGILQHLGISYKAAEVITDSGSSNGTYGVVTADVLNIRAGRGTRYDKIGKLTNGTKVKLLWLADGWWSIDVPLSVSSTGYGFVSAEYINKL